MLSHRRKSGKSIVIAAALAVTLGSGSACAMTAPQSQSGASCRVVGDAKLPAESGGTGALCAAIEAAIAAHAPQSGAQVEVRVQSPSMLSATVTMQGGATLPEQKFASSDRALTTGSFERFARAIATAIANAQPR